MTISVLLKKLKDNTKSETRSQMESVINDIKQNREKATAVIEAAEARKAEMLSRVHVEAKERIQGNQDQNAKTLQELKERLEKENEGKKQDIIKETAKLIAKMKENGEKHLDEVADLLYRTVITVADQ